MEMEGGGVSALETIRGIKNRVKARIRVRVHAALQCGARTQATASSIATRFTVTRVFKGNVIIARLAQILGGETIGREYTGTSLGSSCSRTLASSTTLQQGTARQGNLQLALDKRRPPVTASASNVDCANGTSKAVQALGKGVNGGLEDASSSERALRHTVEDETVPPGADVPLLLQAAQAVALPLVANMCYVFMHGLNRTEVHGAEKLERAIRERPSGQALITVCNHVAAMDDPLVLSAMVAPWLMLDASSMRWTLCATDRCFKNPAMSAFFRSVKVLPVVRGEGVNQKGMDVAAAKVRRGEWVHIFPEGSRSTNGGRTLGAIKRGIGRLVVDSGEQPPLVLPFIHSGMEKVMPRGSKMPTTGNQIVVLVGDPVPVADLLLQFREQRLSNRELMDAISSRVGDKMQILKNQLEAHLLSNEQTLLSSRGRLGSPSSSERESEATMPTFHQYEPASRRSEAMHYPERLPTVTTWTSLRERWDKPFGPFLATSLLHSLSDQRDLKGLRSFSSIDFSSNVGSKTLNALALSSHLPPTSLETPALEILQSWRWRNSRGKENYMGFAAQALLNQVRWPDTGLFLGSV
eukprot:TRINITY_DN16434_c0_g1_i1.p1 TRINITY_DN16434_c0_g1~~TRINITY_DN16434_c0_g1_i1.p1  ORF type:complete len:582 (+),score=94.38 TRINITY_DN16434_c0_g1_i1:829-2574(+)